MDGVSWASREAVGPEVAVAEAAYKEAATDARRRRVDGWNRWVQDALADGAGMLYKWIRVGAPPAPGL
eukprot:3774846-Lingulodinium_polyedra.AAC.1